MIEFYKWGVRISEGAGMVLTMFGFMIIMGIIAAFA